MSVLKWLIVDLEGRSGSTPGHGRCAVMVECVDTVLDWDRGQVKATFPSYDELLALDDACTDASVGDYTDGRRVSDNDGRHARLDEEERPLEEIFEGPDGLWGV